MDWKIYEQRLRKELAHLDYASPGLLDACIAAAAACPYEPDVDAYTLALATAVKAVIDAWFSKIYADCREQVLASLHFVDPSWLPDVAAAIADVPELADNYREAITIVACRVLNEKHRLHHLPVSDTLQ